MKNLFGEEISSKLIIRRLQNATQKVRRTLYDYYNLDIFGDLPTEGKEQMPILQPLDPNVQLPSRMVAFDKALYKDDTDCIVHFYEDDRQFLRIIRNPKKYLPFLKRCAAVIEPDLSQYANMPYAIRQLNAWLNRAIAAWLQKQGVNIIQNITWSTKDSYGYSLAGRAMNTVIAVNCVGVLRYAYSKYLWLQGYKNVALALHPTKIIRYGDKMPNERTDISIYFDNPNYNRRHHGR